MVYEGVGPREAIKRSTQTLTRTWGESLIRHYGLGLIQFLFLMLGVGLGALLFAVLGKLGPTGGIITLGVTFTYMLGVILVFNVAKNVFNTALYVYAKDGTGPRGFDQNVLRSAFRSR